jgi:hypothetical protein
VTSRSQFRMVQAEDWVFQELFACCSEATHWHVYHWG